MEKQGCVQLKVENKDIPHKNATKKKSKDEGNLNEEDNLMKEGMALICVMCRDGKGQFNGLVNLRRPYNKDKWDSHAGGKSINAIWHCGIIG